MTHLGGPDSPVTHRRFSYLCVGYEGRERNILKNYKKKEVLFLIRRREALKLPPGYRCCHVVLEMGLGYVGRVGTGGRSILFYFN